MTYQGRTGAVQLVWPALAYCLVILVIAALGGGWLALGRVDPLLAVPGAGWAALAAMLAMRGEVACRSALVAAACGAAMLAAVGWIEGIGGLPVEAWLMATAALLASSAAMAAAATLLARVAFRRTGSSSAFRIIAWFMLAIAWAGLSWPLVTGCYRIEPADNRLRVTLVTALPLAPVEFRLTDAATLSPDAVTAALSGSARLTRAMGVDAAVLAQTDVLLLAQPPALDPAQLVAIDRWVRGGGRAVVLADGLSSWPPEWPLGDPRNAPVTSLLGPLIGHWGVMLDAPDGMRESSVVMADAKHRVHLFSPGRFRSLGPGCRLSQAGMVGDCRVGKGRAVLVADADFLNPALWAGRHGARSAVDWRASNILWLFDKMGIEHSGGWAEPLWSRRFDAIGQPEQPGQ